MYDLIIVGGGPAGLTAAIYAIRKRLDVLLVSKDLGGKTNHRMQLPWADEYQVIRGSELVDKFRNELDYLDFAHHQDTVEQICRQDAGFVVQAKNAEFRAKAAIVATGANQEFLGVPGEREFLLRGFGFSAISYAPLFIDRRAAVVGDGLLALRSAAELATVAKQVTLIWSTEGLPTSALSRKLMSAENVTIIPGSQVKEITGKEFASGVVVADRDGRTRSLDVDGIFVERGLIPNSKMVAELVDLDAEGRIHVDCSNRTSQPGIFAAGDVTTSPSEQVLIAIGEGAKAALSAYDYLLSEL